MTVSMVRSTKIDATSRDNVRKSLRKALNPSYAGKYGQEREVSELCDVINQRLPLFEQVLGSSEMNRLLPFVQFESLKA
jgi:hypothetical protein